MLLHYFIDVYFFAAFATRRFGSNGATPYVFLLSIASRLSRYGHYACCFTPARFRRFAIISR